MNFAIIVAAGSGSRFGGNVPKQFIDIHGKPLLVHTLQRFESCPAIDSVVLVLSEDRIAEFESRIRVFGISKVTAVVAGGATRARSVANGLMPVPDECEVIAVHDGARPLVSPEEIAKTVDAAREFGAACLTAPVTDTIKTVSGGLITGTVDRSTLRRALTPQAFRAGLLRRSFEGADLSDAATDECFLVEKLGVAIRAIAGDPRNIKVTTPDDLIFAERVLGD